jgi:hypothetical protein
MGRVEERHALRQGGVLMRGLSREFMDDLSEPEGKLHPILADLKIDHSLMLAIRDGYINIYYRGGNIVRVTDYDGLYQTYFDVNYGLGKNVANSEFTINNQTEAEKLVAALPDRKVIMDEYFAAKGKMEREFQQLVARENNNSPISNETEYFISDIEVTVPHLARFDIVAIRWLAKDRKDGSKCRPALIEMKYGDGSLRGDAGLLKHLKDMDSFISDTEKYADLLHTMKRQFNQLDELELLNFNKGSSNAKVKLNPKDKPEVIFIIANHNPRSSILKKIIKDPKLEKYSKSKLFDLRFYVASFAGYGLHADCMHTLAEFQNLCKA